MGPAAKRWLGVGAAVVVFGIVAVTWWTGGRPWAPFVGERRFHIPSEAMTPTLDPGDDVWATPLSDEGRTRLRARDVVVFDCRAENSPVKSCVSRVVAIGGDTVTISDGSVVVNGEPLDEPYLAEGTTTSSRIDPLGEVPQGAVVLLGDNRDNSLDSRYFGPVPVDEVRYVVNL